MGQVKLDCLQLSLAPSCLAIPALYQCAGATTGQTQRLKRPHFPATYSPLQACVKASPSGAPNAPRGSRRRPNLTWRAEHMSSSGYLFVQLYCMFYLWLVTVLTLFCVMYTRQVRFYLAACGVEV